MPISLAVPAILSGVGAVVNGIQGSRAAHNAADAQGRAYDAAGKLVQDTAAQVNPGITAAADAAGTGVTDAARAAGAGVVSAAGDAATGATTAANTAIAGVSPYTSAGSTAATTLAQLMAPGGDLTKTFSAADMSKLDPGYAFRLQQGQQALARAAAAGGLTGAGGTLKAAMRYGQDYSSNEYTNAFNRFQTQQNATFGRLSTLMGMGDQASQWAGNVGVNAAQYGGNLKTGAAQYEGSTNTGAAEWAGGARMNATDLAAQNTLSAANYAANAMVGKGNSQAQGDMNASRAWSGMLGGITNSAEAASMMGGQDGMLGGLMNYGSFDPSGATQYQYAPVAGPGQTFNVPLPPPTVPVYGG